MTLLLLLLSGCDHSSQDTQLEAMSKRGTLRVGTIFGATSYYTTGGGATGYEYELSQAFAEYLGLKLEIVPNYHVSQLFTMLDANQVDMLAGGLTMTQQRLQKYRYSPGYYDVSQKLVFKQGNKRPKNFNQLNGELVVTAQSSHAETLAGYRQQYPQLTWQETLDADPDELLEQVVNGDIAYTIADSTNLAINRRYYPNLSVGFTIQKNQPVGWIITQQNDDSLYSLMIEFFGHMHQSGELITLNDKYFGHVEKFNYANASIFMRATETKLPKYKAMFQKYALDIDWRLLAAISYQESLWNPRAKSPTGVRGIMMLTLPTAKQMGVKSRLDAEQNIRGGGKYINRLLKRVPERIGLPDRLWFALAAYNIGWGHVEDARVLTQRAGYDPDKWIDVREKLPLLKQRKYYKQSRYGYARGDEPVRYVDNIRRYYHSLVWLDEKQLADEKANTYREKLNNSLQNQPDDDQMNNPVVNQLPIDAKSIEKLPIDDEKNEL